MNHTVKNDAMKEASDFAHQNLTPESSPALPVQQHGYPDVATPRTFTGELSDTHKTKLATISSQVIVDRGYETIKDSPTLEGLGFLRSMNPALLIPWRNVHGEIGGYQIRPDVAPKFKGKVQKYFFPKGRKNFADVPPCCVSDLGNPKKPLWIVEGPIKADSLASLGACVLGLAGVSGWHYTNEEGGKTAISCFKEIALNGRAVYICFDSDLKHKPTIRQQALELKKYLESRGAKVYIVDIPDGEKGEKQGPDDFLSSGGTLEQLQSFAVISPILSEKGQEEKKSQADTLLDIAMSEAKVFRNEREEVFAEISTDGKTITYRVRSMNFRAWLNLRHFQKFGRIASSKGALDAAVATLQGLSIGAKTREVFTRVAYSNGKVYYDLGDETGRVVEIDAEGWAVIDASPVPFFRAKGMMPQVLPQKGGSIELLRDLVNVKDEDFSLVAMWLASFFQPKGPRPHLGISAEQGTGKTSNTNALRRLVDPNVALTRKEPKDQRDFMIAAKNNAILAFDNLSHLPQWLSDGLCCLATGAGYATRALYSDDEEEIFSLQRPVIFNAITDVANRPDLLDRVILLELPPLNEHNRKQESEQDAVFEKHAPLILGVLFDAVSWGLKELPHTRPKKLPRMADFATWGAACAPAFGWTQEDFLTAYSRNQSEVRDIAADVSTLAQALEKWAESRHATPLFFGTTTVLLEQLNRVVGFESKEAPDWPKGPEGLGRAIRRLAPVLRLRGLNFTVVRSNSKRLMKVEKNSDGSPPSDQEPSLEPSLLPDKPSLMARTVTATVTEKMASASQSCQISDGSDGLSRYIPSLEGEGKESVKEEMGEKEVSSGKKPGLTVTTVTGFPSLHPETARREARKGLIAYEESPIEVEEIR